MHSYQLIFAALFTLQTVFLATPLAQSSPALPEHVIEKFGAAPSDPDGPLSPALKFAARVAFIDSIALGVWDENQKQALSAIGKSGDPRLAWIISDTLRFITLQEAQMALTRAASELLAKDFEAQTAWHNVTDHLIAWDIPAPPDYLNYKRAIFTRNIPNWDQLFVEGDIDWRHVSWGGVLIDNRAYNATDDGCNCIPAADNPEISNAEDATWLSDDDIVFGVTVNEESRAYPRRIMEVRELVNDTLGGRSLGIPYCTLCGSAQAYFTDQMPEGVERALLRTSGLLNRSNKVMYDLNTYSIIDTFRGNALTGPLADKNIELKQTSVVTSDWATWKLKHPETTVLLERYALGRNPDFRNTRDANGPIFPIGDVDPRLAVHEDVIGAITASGKAVAFPRASALIALSKGREVVFENIRLELDGGGIRAIDIANSDVHSHQAFWFAWSQFNPRTALWLP